MTMAHVEYEGHDADTTPCGGRHPLTRHALIAAAWTRRTKTTSELLALTSSCLYTREDAVKVRVYRGEECDAIDAMVRALKAALKLCDHAFMGDHRHPTVKVIVRALDRAPVADDVLLCGRGVEALDAALEMTFTEAVDERYT